MAELIYSHEVANMCVVAKGPNHGPAPIPEEGAWVKASWAVAFLEYCAQVPANRIGYVDNGGPFNLMQLKIIQEVISLTVFTIMVTVMFKGQSLQWNHFAAFFCLIMAVFFVFLK